MFRSFYPNPKIFFPAAVAWALLSALVWYVYGESIGRAIGFELAAPDAPPVIGVHYFWTSDFLWFYVYFFATAGIFAASCYRLAPHPWFIWSVIGSALLIFSTYFSVQVSVALNNWRRPFFDTVQEALNGGGDVTAADLFGLLMVFAQIASIHIAVAVLTAYGASHYVFRWRTAMNSYYLQKWQDLRHIEGASQRVQEDTMRFANIVESLGIRLVDAVMTLFAFLPILWALSDYVTELPIIGVIPHPLFTAAIFWSLFGTFLLFVVGIRLPGLEFKNQRVEAAFRKELVYGEDDENRAKPPTMAQLFNNVRRNYFRLYFNYMYFNVARYMYLQADNIFVLWLLIPTIAAAAITWGILQQIIAAFGQVSNSFQYLVNSWTTIVDLLSIHKRLQAFEAAIRHQPLSEIDAAYLARVTTNEDTIAAIIEADRP